MRELQLDQSIFIGFKVDHELREKLASLGESDREYVSDQSSTYLRLCGSGEDLYIGKVVDDRLTTDQVQDISRSVVSLIRKVGYNSRLPSNLQIFASGAR